MNLKQLIATVLMFAFCAALLLAGCSPAPNPSPSPSQSAPASNPSLSPVPSAPVDPPPSPSPVKMADLAIGYTFTNHHAPLVIAAAKGDAFADKGVYFKEVLEKEKYILVANGVDIANIDLIVSNAGGDVISLLEMGHINVGLKSIGLPIASIDQGSALKVLGPLHVDGFGLVASNEMPADNFDEFLAYVQDSPEPVKIGYNAPNNSPVILFAESCRELGLTVSEDPMDLTADILMVNLRGTTTLIPALTSGEVDAWVGPSPFPELAVLNNAGKLIIDLRDLPPSGRWTDFACCVVTVTEDNLAENREALEYLYKLLTVSAEFANANKDEAGQIVADWTGVDVEAAKNTMTVFTTAVTQSWLDHAALTYSVLQSNGVLKGAFADKDMSEVMDQIFDLSVFENAKTLP